MSGLDFWIGDWDAAWDGGTGRNMVNRELADRVVVERFEAVGEEPFSGVEPRREARNRGGCAGIPRGSFIPR
jgi:hypothetical protein